MRHTRSIRIITLCTLIASAALAGCTDGCAPVTVPTEVALGRIGEELRTLPILVSGATRIAGEDVPDSHGRLEFVVSVTHPGNENETLNFTDITISGLRLTVNVDNKSLPVEILKVESTNSWTRVGPNSWSGSASSATRLVVWWKVDANPANNPLDIALPEGKPYTASIEFDWTHRDCYATASGHHREGIQDFVQASANAKTFQAEGEPRLEVAASGVGLQADYSIRSGLNVSIQNVEARAIRFALAPHVPTAAANASTTVTATTDGVGGSLNATSEASIPQSSVGLVAFPTINTFVEGNATAKVTPAQRMRIQTTDLTGQTYATSGTMLPAPFDDGPAIYILLVEITYLPDDPTTGSTKDFLAQAIIHT